MWKWMGLFLRKNHLLRCWGWLSLLNWIGTLTLSLLLKLPPRKLEPRFILWSFSPEFAQYLYKSTICRCMEYFWGMYTHYSDRLHDFSVTIPRCYKDICVNNCFLRTSRWGHNLFALLFLVTPCLVVAVQPCMERIPIRKKTKTKQKISGSCDQCWCLSFFGFVRLYLLPSGYSIGVIWLHCATW